MFGGKGALRKKALRHEAAGRNLEAAGLFVEAGDVGEADRLLARELAARTPSQTLEWFTYTAAQATPAVQSRVAAVLGRHIRRLFEEGSAKALGDSHQIRLLAEQLTKLNEHYAAMLLFEAIGDRGDALRAAEDAGEPEAVERLGSELVEREVANNRQRVLLERANLAIVNGAYDVALEALAEAAEKDEAHRQPYQTLRNRVFIDRPFLLEVSDGPFWICLSDEMTFGRGAAGWHIQLGDVGTSRQHLSLRRSQDGWGIRDLGSKNGTYVGGLPLRGEYLVKGAESVRLGPNTELELRPSGLWCEFGVTSGPDAGLRGYVGLEVCRGPTTFDRIGSLTRIRWRASGVNKSRYLGLGDLVPVDVDEQILVHKVGDSR